MKQIYVLFIISFTVFIFSCKKVERVSEIKAKIIEAPPLKVKEHKIKITEEKELFHQLGGYNVGRNEFYIFDYITETAKKNIILTIYDIDNMKEKNKVRLKTGDFMAPGMFSRPIFDISYYGGEYYIFDGKISVFSENFTYEYSAFITDINKYEACGSIDYFFSKDKIAPVLVLYDKRGALFKNKGWSMVFDINMYDLTKLRKARKIALIDSFKLEKMRLTIKKRKGGGHIWYFNYFIPRSFISSAGNKIVYGIGTNNGYYIYDTQSKKKKFIRLGWLFPEKYSDEDARKLALYKKKDINNNKIFKQNHSKAVYRSFNEHPVYYQYAIKINDNEIAFLRDINIEEKTIKAYFIDIDSGKCNQILTIPYPYQINYYKDILPYVYKVLYVDYKKGVYIYGDRDDDWNDIVRYCRFDIK